MNSRKNCLPVAWDSSSDPSYPQPVVVEHTESMALQKLTTYSHEAVNLRESLVWFETSGFYYTINAGPSLRLCSDILLLPCVVEILQLWVCRNLSAPLRVHTLEKDSCLLVPLQYLLRWHHHQLLVTDRQKDGESFLQTQDHLLDIRDPGPLKRLRQKSQQFQKEQNAAVLQEEPAWKSTVL
ncbi:hypothetical protein STEG23_015980, partial [Scotinomys teguina]